jgi:hypothetical protein
LCARTEAVHRLASRPHQGRQEKRECYAALLLQELEILRQAQAWLLRWNLLLMGASFLRDSDQALSFLLIAEGAVNLDQLSGDGDTAHPRRARGGLQARGEYLGARAKQDENLNGIGRWGQRVNRRKHTEAAGRNVGFDNWTNHR